MKVLCRIFGHAWIEGAGYLVCRRCPVDTRKGWPPIPKPFPPPPTPPKKRAAAVCLLTVVGIGTLGLAQVPVGPPSEAPPVSAPAAVAPPALDELEQAWLKLVAISEQLAYSECQRLESVQKYNATLADVAKRLEARHPGFTLDRARGVLVAKGKP